MWAQGATRMGGWKAFLSRSRIAHVYVELKAVLFFTYDLPPSPPFLSFQSASEFVALGSNSREVVWLYIAVTPLL